MSYHGQFYLTLPSNTETTDGNGENKTSAFCVHLPERIQLEGADWEVGLAEILYPHSWQNITEQNDTNKIRVFYLPTSEWFETSIPCAYYNNINTLVTAIKEAILSLANKLKTYPAPVSIKSIVDGGGNSN